MNSKPKSNIDLLTPAKSGDRLETLKALRDLLAERLQESNSDRDIASMSRRLMQTVEEIETLERNKQARESNNLVRIMRNYRVRLEPEEVTTNE